MAVVSLALAGCSSDSPGSCEDGVRNGSETDRDCGGACGACGDGLACDQPGDCASGVCDAEVCAAPRCGDGVIDDATEQCDDGAESAACDADCTSAACGDGAVNAAAGEGCDDGNDDDTDACPSSCEPARCGDGFIRAGIEQCDDGNDDDTDACPSSCEPARCGDGFVRDGVEQCDDGNLEDTDFCTNGCVAATCDDAVQNGDETDVDCGGQCGPVSCEIGQACARHLECRIGGCGGVCEILEPVAAGGEHTCAQLPTGGLRCWGFGAFGQLGYGNVRDIGDDELPTAAGLVVVGSLIRQIATGLFHTCAVVGAGQVRCWGYNEYGQLGYGHDLPIGNDESPMSVGNVQLGGLAVRLAIGGYHTCALLEGGDVKCWGDNSRGQLGQGDTADVGDDEVPANVSVIDLGATAIQIAAGGLHTCALLAGGAVKCWGFGAFGQLGYGNTEDIGDDELPAVVGAVDLGGPAVAIAAGWFHTCALLAGGDVRCWGDGQFGQLGRGDTATIGDDELPSVGAAIALGGVATAIAAGVEHTCAVLEGGAMRCWGEGGEGQLGYGNTAVIGDDEAPATAGAVPVGGAVTGVSIGLGYHTCAVLTSGAVRCWGHGARGQLGHGNTDTIGDDEPASAGGDVSL